jgi:glycosyltransferase involved in cell wall biosynthesis
MRVLQITPNLGIGGLERMASQLGVELTERGLVVAFCSPEGEPFESWLRERGIHVFRIAPPRATVREQLVAAKRIASAIADFKPDIVHAHNPAASVATAVGRRISGARPGMVTTYHGVSDRRLRRATRVLRHVPGVVVGCGPAAAAELRRGGLRPERLLAVANGVGTPPPPTGRIRGELRLQERPLVVNVGRCVPQKNQQFLLDVGAILKERASPARIVIVGGGPLEAALRREVRARELDDVVCLTGARGDGQSFIAEADVFALCSDWEGFPLTVLEAMSAGTPVVACRVRGVEDLIEDRKTGLLVERSDAVAFADALESVLADRVGGAKLASAARRRVSQRFSLGAMADAYLDIYRGVLSR